MEALVQWCGANGRGRLDQGCADLLGRFDPERAAATAGLHASRAHLLSLLAGAPAVARGGWAALFALCDLVIITHR
jgi:hypothetical protein